MSDKLSKAVAEAGGTLVTVQLGPLPTGRNGGCGAPTRVAGTNGGWMPCGSLLTNLGKTEPYYCGACHAELNGKSNTPLFDAVYAAWLKTAELNLGTGINYRDLSERLMEYGKQMERDRTALMEKLSALLDSIYSLTDQHMAAKELLRLLE